MSLKDGKILVIDDLPDWRQMIGGLLVDAGYNVDTAASADEAMRLLRQQPYHVAIIDLRLDERDELNQEGLQLAEQMKAYLPELAILILTGFANIPAVKRSLQPRENGLSIAFDFLEKHEIAKLLPSIQNAFTNAARVNPQLTIEYVDEFSAADLKAGIKCLQSLESEMANREIVDLFQRIFYESDRIQVRAMNGGHSSGAVVLVSPVNQDMAQTDVVVKFNQRDKAETESRNYDLYVANYVGGARRTQRLDFRATARLGGIAYSFVGAEIREFQRFGHVYVNKNVDVIKHIIDNLFKETCYTWYTKTGLPGSGPRSLGADYRKWLRLDASKLMATLTDLVRQSHLAHLSFVNPRLSGQSEIFFEERRVNLLNPLPLSHTALIYKGPYCFTHGDLHEGNILVDSHNQTWLIDFYHTGPAHPVRDFAILESAIKFSLQQSAVSLPLLYDWERGLIQADALSAAVSFNPPLQLDSELSKATALIDHIRSLAGQILPEATMRDYLISLYFHALKGLTLLEKFSERQRLHALYSASLIVERLQKPSTSG